MIFDKFRWFLNGRNSRCFRPIWPYEPERAGSVCAYLAMCLFLRVVSFVCTVSCGASGFPFSDASRR